MKYGQYFVSLFLLFLTSCSSEEVPSDLIKEEKMAKIMKDLQIAYSGIDITEPAPDQRAIKYEEANQAILEKYNEPRDLFDKSFDWYKVHPEKFDSIYANVIRGLEVEINHAPENDSLAIKKFKINKFPIGNRNEGD